MLKYVHSRGGEMTELAMGVAIRNTQMESLEYVHAHMPPAILTEMYDTNFVYIQNCVKMLLDDDDTPFEQKFSIIEYCILHEFPGIYNIATNHPQYTQFLSSCAVLK